MEMFIYVFDYYALKMKIRNNRLNNFDFSKVNFF